MKTAALFLLGSLLPFGLTAAFAALPAPSSIAPLLPQPGEPVLLPSLKGIVLLPSAPATTESGPGGVVGLDASRVPGLQSAALARELAPFIGQPASLGSLDRLQGVLRLHLQIIGRPFARVFMPPQDITDGTVRFVVQLSLLDGEVRVDGPKWFARERYTEVLHLRTGEWVDAVALGSDVAWLNRNPYRRVSPVIEAGDEPASTRITLRTEESFPLTLSAGYDNTGTLVTDEERVFAGFTWGNALGRGDLFNYRFTADPSAAHLRSHSGGYTAFLPWRHMLSLQGAYSTVESIMPEPFTQRGSSWQVGLRYEIPLQTPRAGWTQNLSFTADFKYSDNTLEFATIPVTNNVTHVVQFGATYGVSFRALGGQNSASVSGFASPGGVTRYNRTRAFDSSRADAKADYVYGKLNLSHQHLLWHGFSWVTNLDAQFASGALLGSEQLTGTGSYAVRGYRDSSAFGDWGVVVNNEVHAPAFNILKGQDNLDLFAFVDAASLNLNVDHESTDLRSVGFALSYNWRRYLSVRASYGWQLKYLDRSTEKARAHLGVTATF